MLRLSRPSPALDQAGSSRSDPSVRPPTQLELKFLDAIAEIQGIDPRESGEVAYLSRAVVQANLPYRDPGRRRSSGATGASR